jgi:uncharacterized protein (DUF433 family)
MQVIHEDDNLMSDPIPAQKALDLMRREPGVANTLRFLHQYSTYTRRLRVPGVNVMTMIHGSELRGRITIDPAQCGGDPCIRGMRIRVSDVMDLLGDGLTPSDIVQEMPDLEAWDILAAIHYAIGDYVEYRKILFRGVTVEEIFEEARRRQNRKVDGDEQ